MHVLPKYARHFTNIHWPCDQVLLVPRNDAVDLINWGLLQLLSGQEYIFKSLENAIYHDQTGISK